MKNLHKTHRWIFYEGKKKHKTPAWYKCGKLKALIQDNRPSYIIMDLI